MKTLSSSNAALEFLRQPFDRFFRMEAAGSILLLLATMSAIVLANSPLHHQYQYVLNTPLSLGLGSFLLSKPLILWINDGLMAIFFFVIGLEIKRELIMGELSTLRKASLPIMAAIGGVIFPILIYLAFNWGKPTVDGWAIPMATDIAFTIGILKLLGKRVPYGLLIFLTAFAIVDDLASVMVIAIYYSTGINWTYIFFALGIIVFLYILGRMGIYTHALYLIPGLVVWYLFLKSGIHPTIAGVMLAFTIPVRRRIRNKAFEQNLIRCFDSFTKGDQKWSSVLLTQQQLGALDRIESLTYLVQPPLQFLENRLHAWVIYFIMPVFALANAGVNLGIESFAGLPLILSIAIALLAGKSIGISLLAWLAIKLNIAELPEHTSFRQLVGAAFLGGLGFTMSLFIANLSFSDPAFLSPAKAGILLGSMLSGVIGYLLLRFTKPLPEAQLFVEELESEEAPAC